MSFVVDCRNVLCCMYTVQFKQHRELWQQLLDTGDARIVFVSKTDWFLGSHCDAAELAAADTFHGKNWLGKSLMKLRQELQVLVQ